MLHRRPARDYGNPPTRSEAILAMTGLMARRVTGENAISWCNPAPQTNQQIPGCTPGEDDLLAADGRHGAVRLEE